MLKLSRLADYGVMLLSEMATSSHDMQTAQAMADATGLPQPTVSKLLSALARCGLLEAVRGVKGGFRLGRPAATISIADVIAAIDGPVALTQCIEQGPGRCGVEALCPTRRGWAAVNEAIRSALERVTLEDFLTPAPWAEIVANGTTATTTRGSSQAING